MSDAAYIITALFVIAIISVIGWGIQKALRAKGKPD